MQGAAADRDRQSCVVAEHRTERGEHAGAAVGAGRSAEGQDDAGRAESQGGARRPRRPPPTTTAAGRECPRAGCAARRCWRPRRRRWCRRTPRCAVCGSPVAAATVTSTGRNPASMAAATLPSPPSASGSPRCSMPRCSSPLPRWWTTSAAVRLPLNLSGARRTFMTFSFVSSGRAVGSTPLTACRRPRRYAAPIAVALGPASTGDGSVASPTDRCQRGHPPSAPSFCGLPRDGVRRRGLRGARGGGGGVVADELRALDGQRVLGGVDLVGQVRHRLAVEDPADPVDVDGPVPPGDEQGGDGVADEVDQGAALGHELVDAEDQHDAGGRDGADGAQGGGEGDEPAAGDAGRTLGGQQHDGQQADLLAEGQVRAGGLGDVDRGQRQVDRGAVEVEAVPGGDDEPDDAALRRRRTPACASGRAAPARRWRCRRSAAAPP